MPRGKYVNHKGRNRNFTNPEELEAQRKKDEEEKKWRKTREQDSDEDEDEDGDGDENDSDESDSEEEENAKGAAGVIQIQNPNRVAKKSHRKVEEVAEDDEPQLTRREKEELEKQRAAAAYQKRHAEGKTAQAKADLARLAIIKQHRAEAAARREAEKKGSVSPLLSLFGKLNLKFLSPLKMADFFTKWYLAFSFGSSNRILSGLTAIVCSSAAIRLR
uniref:Casein kinase substrate phosphoprotein PP28 domain-containing protein n=1 Tax=Anopheles melas TaxID=34690 RepID=A0A182TXA4_9DIPT